MEIIRKRCNVYLETDPDHFLRQTAKPTYKGCKIFHKNLVAVNMMKRRLLLNKPSYVGMCILDLSTTLTYDFHYNFIKSKYGEKAILLFTDTDSLCYEIKTEDVYEDLYKHKGLFDNSDYPKSSKFFFKDEAAGMIIIDFAGLKPKMYSYRTESKNNKTAKGVKKNVIKKDMTFRLFRLPSKQSDYASQDEFHTIRSPPNIKLPN